MSLLAARRGIIASRSTGGGGGGGGYSTEIIADSPFAYWRLGESSGTTAADEISTNDGTYVNTPTLGVSGATSDGDTAVNLDPAGSEYLSIPALATGAFTNGDDWTFEIWLSADAHGGDKRLLSARSNISGMIRLDSGTIGYYNTATWVNLGTLPAAGTGWHHLVVCYDASANQGQAYIDGVAQTAQTVGSGNNHNPFTTIVDIGRPYTGAFGAYFDGGIDELAVYDRLLTSTEVSDHYNAA